MDNWNYYSVSFLYDAAIRGLSGGGIHIGFYVDEHKENERLTKAMDFVDEALCELRLDYRHEYCYPDGSLYKFIRTEYGLIELTIALQSKLKDMRFKIVPVSCLYEVHPDTRDTLEKFFMNTIGELGQRKKSLMRFVYQGFDAVLKL